MGCPSLLEPSPGGPISLSCLGLVWSGHLRGLPPPSAGCPRGLELHGSKAGGPGTSWGGQRAPRSEAVLPFLLYAGVVSGTSPTGLSMVPYQWGAEGRALSGWEPHSCCLAKPWTWGSSQGLTRGGGQQAQVGETLVPVELPLLKQEVHHLRRWGLWLGDRGRDRWDRAASAGGVGAPAALTWQTSSSRRRRGPCGGAGHMPVSGHPHTTSGRGVLVGASGRSSRACGRTPT